MDWALKRHYRRIDLAHMERIPKNKAVILAANHPTAFIEPCILACFLDRPLYFLVRGDLFKKPLFRLLLEWLHMLPVYRIQDGGYQNLKQNYDTFAACFKALSEKRTIMILAEGRCIHEKRLRPLKKGTARLALGALEADPTLDEVYIVPVGVNYTHADRVNSEVMIRFGEPILASRFRESYAKQPNLAINELTDVLKESMREHVIHIDHPEDDRVAENMLTIAQSSRSQQLVTVVTNSEKALEHEKAVVETINRMEEKDKNSLKSLTGEYFGRLAHLGLDDASLTNKYARKRKSGTRLLAGLPFALTGFLWHLPPLLIAESVATTKVKTIEFYAPVRLAVWLATTVFYSLIWITLPLITAAWWWLALPLIALLSFPWLINYLSEAKQWYLGWRVGKMEAHDLKYLKKLRALIMEVFNQPETNDNVTTG
jgi:1-acyl-sn-glycerol-3-phosphate acyltransferase